MSSRAALLEKLFPFSLIKIIYPVASATEDQFKNMAVEFNAVTVNTGGGREMGVAIGNTVDENELERAGRLEESRKLVEDTNGKTNEVEMDLTVDIECNIVYNEIEGFCITLCEDAVLVLIKLVRSVSCELSNTIVDVANIYVDLSTVCKDLLCEGINLVFIVMVAVMRGRDV